MWDSLGTEKYSYEITFNGVTQLMEIPPLGDETVVTHFFEAPEALLFSHPYTCVLDFHLVMGMEQVESNTWDMFNKENEKLLNFRRALVDEEYNEFLVALLDGKPVEVVDALIDLIYVCYGMLIAFKYPALAGFYEVHRSNMSKLDHNGMSIKRGDGKVIKGPNYKKADLAQFMDWGTRADPTTDMPFKLSYANAEEFLTFFSAPGVAKD